MPGAGTHTTVIQHLALLAQSNSNPDFRKFLTDPTLNTDWTSYASAEALQSRYAVLGSFGPDIFFLMLDYGGGVQQFEDVAIKIAGTFSCVGQVSSELNQYVNTTLDALTLDVWKSLQDTFKFLSGILVNGLLDLLIDKNNFWFFFLPLREVDDYRENWYWADTLHYVKTGCFTQKLLDNAKAYQAADPESATAKCMSAYALGYLTHYVADTIGHAYVNRIVESPWRNAWQRHHLVENFIDTYVWASWHDEGSNPTEPSADERHLDSILKESADATRDRAASLHYARLNDLSNVGSPGIDPIVDSAISSVCNLIQQGLFDIGASSLPPNQTLDDPIFKTWTQFIADAMWQTYPPTEPHPTRMGRYPTPDDVAGAYGAYRILLSLATEDDVDKPQLPNIAGDLSSILNQMVSNIMSTISSVPPPPSVGGQGFSLDALWDATKEYVAWLGQVADAAINVLGDLIAGLIEGAGTLAADTIKVGLYVLNSILYSIYHSLRMTLVMSAYSVPFNEDLMANWGPLDLRTLWNATNGGDPQRYPIEPVVSERDFGADYTKLFSPYRPYFRPSDLAPVNIESPATTFPQEILKWSTPDDMLATGAPGADNMFSPAGPAPPTSMLLPNPDGSKLTDLETFDGSQRYFGSIFANCTAALNFAVPYISGTPYPAGTVLPDYNLDCDRGFAWPCWDVDYSHGSGMVSFPWNGADPFPADTLVRVNTQIIPAIPVSVVQMPLIDWGSKAPPLQGPVRPGLMATDPWGSPRSGDAWINAVALNSANAGPDLGMWISGKNYSQGDVVTDPNDGNRYAAVQDIVTDTIAPSQDSTNWERANTTGGCGYAEFPFPSIVINPNASGLSEVDSCSSGLTNPDPPSNGLLSVDYQFAQSKSPHFLHSDPSDQNGQNTDLVNIFLNLPYVGATTPENDGRLADVLRALASTADPKLILANAVSLKLGRGITPLDWNGAKLTDTSPIPVDDTLAAAVAQLAVTGRNSFSKFSVWEPGDASLVTVFNDTFLNPNVDPTELQNAVKFVLDTAYTTLWAIKSNVPGWRQFRSSLGWIAVSGFDDTPHRPVNVPTAPYPQFDISFDVPIPNPDPQKHGLQSVTTRYMVASVHKFVGPNDAKLDSFLDPDPSILEAPAIPFSTSPAPRALPQEEGPFDSIPADDQIIIYVHGGGSRAEEGVDMANSLIIEGQAVGRGYTVICFDLPNSAYASAFDVTDVVGAPYNHKPLLILQFEQDFIVGFIEALDQQLGNIKGRVVAVMGGSLGGNTSLLLTGGYNKQRTYLQTIVSWSVTAISPSKYLGFIKSGDVATLVSHMESQATSPESRDDHTTEAQYIAKMYAEPLSALLNLPPQPILWYRGGYATDGRLGWQPCKDQSVARSRFDRYEIYSPTERHWTTAIDLEQISFSFQDDDHRLVVTSAPDGAPTPNLLLVASEQDNYFPNAIYNSTIELARQIRLTGHGKAEFWLDTGHSIHSERPRLFAAEIVYFLTHLDASDSPNGIVVSTPPQAVYSMIDR